MVFTGQVISVSDEYGANRIKVRIKNADNKLMNEDLPYAWPLLPKSLCVPPKVNESVLVLCESDNPRKQRYYIGPIIPQYQSMFFSDHNTEALTILNGNGAKPQANVDNIPEMTGAFAKSNEIAIYGRKNSDIILGDTDLRIRCGARLADRSNYTKLTFNLTNPSVIKLKYHEDQLMATKRKWNDANGDMSDKRVEVVESSVNVIGQEINLISTNGSPYVKTSNTDSFIDGNESISDKDIKEFIEKAHPIPYGDILLRYLFLFKQAFANHTHRFHQLPPVHDVTFNTLDKFVMDDILSKNVRIN